LKVVLDLMVVKFFSRYLVKPIYVFGGFGVWPILGGVAMTGYALYLKFFEATSLIQTPLPVLAPMLILIGITSILMGLLSAIMVPPYFASQGLSPYNARTLLNFEGKS